MIKSLQTQGSTRFNCYTLTADFAQLLVEKSGSIECFFRMFELLIVSRDVGKQLGVEDNCRHDKKTACDGLHLMRAI